MQDHVVLRRPLITERATALNEQHNQVCFEVALHANKNQVRRAVETLYGVRVEKVRTAVIPGKLKRRGKSVGYRSTWKKAIVSLASGDTIDFFGAE
jgi:large subunit ribosomal protein L23